MTIYINQNGRCVCPDHGGSYLQTAIARGDGDAEFVHTPIDVWINTDKVNILDGGMPHLTCEDC